MDVRRDLFPPLFALALSAAVHGGLAWLNPELFSEPKPEAEVSVVVEYLPASQSEGTQAGGSLESAPLPSPPPEPVEEPLPPPRVVLPTPPETAAPEPPSPGAATTPEEGPPEPPVTRHAAPPEETPAEQPPPPAPEVAAVPALRELLPRPEELRSYSPAEAMLPDPAGGSAREATLTLGDPDVRYKGYLASVRGAIDRSWRWKEAIMAAGRGGRVLVRFTLEAKGHVADVEVSETSGSPILDREAMQTVARAPFPPFPSHWTVERLNLFAQFNYRLE